MLNDHRRLPGGRFQEHRLVSCSCSRPLQLRHHWRTRDARGDHVPQADYEPLFFSVNKLIPNDGANWRQLHPFDARLFETESETNFTPVPEWRLCMAASRRAQHKKRASRTKRLLFKTISRIAQIIEERAATRRARFSFCRPISFKHLGKL